MNPLARLDEYPERYALNIASGLRPVFAAVESIITFSVYTLRSGDAAVIRSRFSGGEVTDRVYLECIHLEWPWNTADCNALSADGINVFAQMSFLYKTVTPDAQGALPSLPGDGMSLPFPNQHPSDAATHH